MVAEDALDAKTFGRLLRLVEIKIGDANNLCIGMRG